MSLTDDLLLAIIMPCFNEEEGVFEFVSQLQESFKGVKTEFIIIDDLSTDTTAQQLNIAKSSFANIVILSNSENMGHGPTTIRGLNFALKRNANWILAVDGDGQFHSEELRASFDLLLNSQAHVLEGVRVGRKDPYFRRIITLFLRFVVFVKTRSLPSDANTPFRIYRKETLELMLPKVNPSSLVPNIEISILSRKLGFSIVENNVMSRDRLGTNKVGTTWKSTRNWLPSSRFVRFCFNASKQLLASIFK